MNNRYNTRMHGHIHTHTQTHTLSLPLSLSLSPPPSLPPSLSLSLSHTLSLSFPSFFFDSFFSKSVTLRVQNWSSIKPEAGRDVGLDRCSAEFMFDYFSSRALKIRRQPIYSGCLTVNITAPLFDASLSPHSDGNVVIAGKPWGNQAAFLQNTTPEVGRCEIAPPFCIYANIGLVSPPPSPSTPTHCLRHKRAMCVRVVYVIGA